MTQQLAWPPGDWVLIEVEALLLRRLVHRSGVEIIVLADANVIVHRGETQEARQLAARVEDHLHGIGYSLMAGTNADTTVIYTLPSRR